MNDLGLPPDRELPSQTRERIYDTVRAGMDGPRRRPARVPLGIAAAVAVLAGGAVYVNGTGSEDVPVSTAGNADVDRCWTAIQHSDQAGAYPAREAWRQLFRESLPATTVTGIRAGDTSLFCETSLTSVSVSAPITSPQPPEGQRVSTAMSSPNGTVVGFVESGIDQVQVRTQDPVGTDVALEPAPLAAGPFAVRDGIFVGSVALNDVSDAGFVAVLGLDSQQDEQTEQVLPAPPPAVYQVDRPAEPAEDSSAAGAALTACLNEPGNGGGPVVDTTTWRAGALFDRHFPAVEDPESGRTAAAYDSTFVVATNGRASATCSIAPSWDFRVHPAPETATSPELPIALLRGGSHFPGLTVAGVTSADVAKLRLEAAGATVDVDVHARTFAAFVPGVEPDGAGIGASAVTATAYDAAGGVLYRGPLPRVPKE
ncbi:hypothetical protein [Qaidamihabitans albus]|uniref:hypothetical protein n=1 Tax=Qaidamihabitans albus TaxID=2795733 RepID=UPI0018F21306|nr:hypothetical protein [Qaidamihabitans albus]